MRLLVGILCIVGFLFPIDMSFASPVSVETATQVALNWCEERGPVTAEQFAITEHAVVGDPEALYYVFNVEPAGFVLVAADDAVVPVLGYNFVHYYTNENHPPQFDAMLESFGKQISFTEENGLLANETIAAEWKRLNVPLDEFEKADDTRNVAPLLATLWNQDWPWNHYCPADPSGPGGHVYAGCGAVAMAQVMKYWSHPVQGEGQNSYYLPDYGTQSANFGETTYDWANMSNNTATSATKTLLYHCGVAIYMDYGPNGSGAYPQDLVPAFENFFRYDNAANLKWKQYYSSSAWENLVRTELDNGRPLVYIGYGTGGHAFNLDGYQGTNYFHFNWGWSGYYNGYYYLNDLTPGGYNFTNDQAGVFNLFPEPGSDATPPDAIADLAGIPSGSDLVLSWSMPSDNVGVVGYWIYQRTNAFGEATALQYVTGAETLTYTISDVCGNAVVNYFYDVRAVDAAQNLADPSNCAGEFDLSLQ